jgi:hypothetical protein
MYAACLQDFALVVVMVVVVVLLCMLGTTF